MMRQVGIAIVLLALAVPAQAEPPAAPPSAPVPLPAPVPVPPSADSVPSRPDAARLAAARRLIDLFVPPGSFREFMEGFMPDDDGMLALIAEQLGIDTTGMTREQRIQAVQERGASRDPHFRERFRIMMEVTRRVAAETMAELEPQMRDVMVTLMARQFSVAELDELSAFFRTPVGARYARLSITMMRDPAWQEMYTLMAPRMAEMQRRLEAEMAAATAHLDPVPQS